MAANDLAKTQFIYKRRYAKGGVPESVKRKHQWFSMLRKEDDWTGDNDFRYGIADAYGQGIAGSVTNAKANASAIQGQQFQAARKKLHGFDSIDGEAMAAARDDDGAFFRLVTRAMDGLMDEHIDTLAMQVFRDGNGYRGQVSSISANLITLTNQDDVRWFKRGMTLQVDDTITGLSPRSGTMKVTKVDYANSQITVDSAVAGTAANDYLFRNGEVSTFAIEGMQQIIPASAGTFRGADCTLDRERYAGWYINDPIASVEENAGLIVSNMSSYGANSEDALLILHPKKAWEVIKRQQAKVTYDGGGKKALVGFATVQIMTPMGSITMLPDADCPIADAWVLDPSTWYLKTLYKAPHANDDDGNPWLRLSDEDALEYRTRSMCNLICDNPVRNGRFKTQ